jgi:hypothetical protein
MIFPAYIQYFDVCMNPQSVNDLTIGITQEKLMNIWLWEKL